jgi:acetolactate synthase regulatory subunit
MTVKAHPHNLERVLTALEKRGVVIEEDGIRLTTAKNQQLQ